MPRVFYIFIVGRLELTASRHADVTVANRAVTDAIVVALVVLESDEQDVLRLFELVATSV